jgi:hypothetical protein
MITLDMIRVLTDPSVARDAIRATENEVNE